MSCAVTLVMPRPVKGCKSGIYNIRVRVPADLLATVCRVEISRSLRTREPVEAKERLAAEYAATQRRWAAKRTKPEALAFKQIVSVAAKIYLQLMAAWRLNPVNL
ncbi:DUF6538 domain-containing protein [Ruegeria sp. PrR005]|uniref:DUF6538 domain-containing protein n=1 Tax=Ruegeria sp. PrR005 TaxID=2706882 RepID=UPI00351A6B6D